MAKNSTARATIEVTTNATKAKNDIEAVNNLLKKLQKTKQLMMKEGLAFDKDGKETATFKKLNQDIKTATQALKDNTSAQEKMKATLNDLGNIRLKDLKRRYRELSKELGNFSGKEMAQAKQWRNNLATIKAKIVEIEGAGAGAAKSMIGFGGSLKTTLKNLVAYGGVFALFGQIKQKIVEVIEKNRELSDQLANIRKVSNLPMADINELANRLATIDTRSSVQQLNELAYTASKLGYGSYGIEGLESFVKSALKVENALREDMGSDSMGALSKMVEVMGLIPKMGVEKAMDATGSAIFKLAATSTATGSNIMEFSKRLMGLANVAGISTQELLGFGASADVLAQMPEVAATAFNKLITAMQRQPNLIENSLKIEPGTISDLYQAGHMADAILLVFQKMREKGGMNALTQSGVFKDLGSDGARLVGVMTTMANRVDLVEKQIKTAREAFSEGTAVAQEYAIQMETAEAYMERAANMWTKAFVNPEGVDLTKEFAQAWYDVSKSMTQTQASALGIHLIMKGLFGILKLMVQLLPSLIAGLSAWGVTAGMAAFVKWAKEAGGLMTALRTAMAGMSFAGWVGAITGAGMAIFTLYEHLKTVNDEIKRGQEFMVGFSEDLNELTRRYESAEDEVIRYKRAIDDAAVGTKEHTAAIQNFNDKFGGYLDNLLTEKSTALEIANAYNQVCRQLRNKMALELRDKELEEFVQPEEKKRADIGEAYEDRVKGSQYSQFNRSWLRGYVLDDTREDLFTSVGAQVATARDINLKMGLGLTPQQLQSIVTQVNQGRAQYSKGNYRTVGASSAGTPITYYEDLTTETEKIAFDAIRFIRQEERVRKATKKVYDKYDDEIDPTLGKKKGLDEDRDPLKDAPDKGADKKARAEAAARRKALRAEMKEEQAQAKAIIDNVRNYYQRQINAITEMANTTGMDPKMQEQMVNGMKERMNTALANVRKAIGGTKNEWDEFKQTMRQDLYEPMDENGTNLSTELLDKVMDNNLEQLRKMIITLSQELNQQGSVLLDQILRKATESEGINAKIENTLMRAREKELLEKNYTGKVDKDTEGVMEQFGIAAITDAQSRQIRDWSAQGNDPAIQHFLEMRTKYWQVAFGNARKNLVELIQADVSSQQGQESVLQLLFGEDWKEGLTGSELEGILNMTADQWQVFYMKLIEYTDNWTDAQKKAYDEVKKRQDYLFENSTDVMGLNSLEIGYQQQAKANSRWGKPQTFAERLGLGSLDNISNDPEVKMMEIKLTKAELYYKRMEELRKQDKISEEQLQTAKEQWASAQEALMDKIAEQAKEKMQQIQALLDPIKDFGAAAGEAMYMTVNGLDGEGEAWRNAIKSIIKTYGEMTIQMIEKQLIQMLVMKQHHQEQEDEEQAHQDRMKQIQGQGNNQEVSAQNILNAKIISLKKKGNKAEEKEDKSSEENRVDIAGQGGQTLLDLMAATSTGMVNIKKEEAQETQQIEQQQQATSLSGLITDTVAKVVLGIAGGSAKTISELGWWGLPLVAVISAALMGLLNYALSAIGSGSKQSNNNAAKTNVKLKSGMLTYDEGNVQNYVGNDGHVYRAREADGIPEGVSLVKQPIATTVNGQPSLVAEKGPEIVIGRKTTQRIMMNEPRLLHHLATLGNGRSYGGYRGLRTFDDGNLGDVLGGVETGRQGGQDNSLDAETKTALQQLPAAMAAFSQVMATIQQQGIPGYFKKYGAGSLDEGMREVNAFRKRYPVG